jgi:hypothetical protein
MAVSVCLALAFTPLMADRNDRAADRTKASQRGATADDPVSIHPVVRAKQLQWRHAEDLSSANRAAGHVAAAANLEGDAAISELMAAINMGVADEKLLSEAYASLGDLYNGVPAKQVHFYALAMQYTAEPEARAQLQSRIVALGGDVLALSVRPNNNVSSSMGRGPGDDTCDVSVPITLPWYENMSITPAGDANWRSFDIPGPELWAIRIETISPNPPYVDDTDLTLWADCVEGTPQGQLAFNDDGGVGFMSLIQTACIPPGTYYIEVGGFADFTVVPDFDLDVQITEICIPSTPDGYEPDDERYDATSIGKPGSIPEHANGWGRAKDEIQAHTIAPALDLDNVKFAVTPGAERVDMRLAQVFPTKWNDFESVPGGTDFDSFIELLYGNEPDYGGFCNDPDAGFSPHCRADSDCPPPVGEPLPGLPACIPIYFFSFGGSLIFFPENPLAFNEDISFSDWASALNVCLPRSDNNTPSATADGDWTLRIGSSPTYDPFGDFDYQVQVKNLYKCAFETEPNNGPFGANALTLGETMSGFQEYSVFLGLPGGNDPQGSSWFFTDPDWFSFDVDVDSVVQFATDGYDSYLCDTNLDLYVGPDDDGFYYYTGVSDDDGGPGWLSAMGVIVPPANDLLGNTVADADYFLDVTSLWLNTNFPWDLYSAVAVYVPPVLEVEPNDDCSIGNVADPGQPIESAINPTCDYDAYTFTITENTYVVLETFGSSDSTMILEGAGAAYIGCDDDSGDGLMSRIEGCLPPGDYCARVRAYSGFSTFAYDFEMSAQGSCAPTVPPTVLYDELFRCDGSGYAGPQDEFNTCPN